MTEVNAKPLVQLEDRAIFCSQRTQTTESLSSGPSGFMLAVF